MKWGDMAGYRECVCGEKYIKDPWDPHCPKFHWWNFFLHFEKPGVR